MSGKKFEVFDIYKLNYLTAIDIVRYTLHNRGITFSKTEAARLVGGEAKLHRLISENRIRCSRANERQNGRWQCDAGDVIKYMKF